MRTTMLQETRKGMKYVELKRKAENREEWNAFIHMQDLPDYGRILEEDISTANHLR